MNILLLNLAVADMMVGLFIAPRFIFIHLFKHPDGLASKVFCELLTGGNLAWYGGVTSVFTLVVIAFERYYAVMYPYGNRGKLTYNKLKVQCMPRRHTVFIRKSAAAFLDAALSRVRGFPWCWWLGRGVGRQVSAAMCRGVWCLF